MKLGIVDYGVGNIFSLQNAFSHIGIDTIVSKDANVLDNCWGIILPGVGAFGDAASNLTGRGLDTVVKNQAAKGKLILGICLGMQLLYDYSTEGGSTRGLGLLKGWIDRLPEGIKVPHMGWNTMEFRDECKALKGVSERDHVYFVHSYYARVDSSIEVCAVCSHGVEIAAVVKKDNILGMQFHPEKSGETGMKILKNIKEMLI